MDTAGIVQAVEKAGYGAISKADEFGSQNSCRGARWERDSSAGGRSAIGRPLIAVIVWLLFGYGFEFALSIGIFILVISSSVSSDGPCMKAKKGDIAHLDCKSCS